MNYLQQEILTNHQEIYTLMNDKSGDLSNVAKLCRLCMSSSSEDFVNLFRHSDGINYAEQILEFLSIDVITHGLYFILLF